MEKLMTMVALAGTVVFPGAVVLPGTMVAAQQNTAVPVKAAAVKATLAQDQIKTTTIAGKAVETVIADPKTVLPGDVLREEVTVLNVSGKTVRRPVISVPVPKGTLYAGGTTPSGERWNTHYSIDGGKNYAAMPMKTVTVSKNGRSVTKRVAAPTSDYTNVRWLIGQLGVAESLKLSFRVRVN